MPDLRSVVAADLAYMGGDSGVAVRTVGGGETGHGWLHSDVVEILGRDGGAVNTEATVLTVPKGTLSIGVDDQVEVETSSGTWTLYVIHARIGRVTRMMTGYQGELVDRWALTEGS